MTERSTTEPMAPNESPQPDVAETEAAGAARRSRGRKGQGPVVRRVLNLRLVIVTLVIVVAAGVALYFWHGYQVRRTSESFLTRAEALEQEEEWGEAADYLQRYVRMEPDDVQARIRLVRALDRAATDGRAKQRLVGAYYQTLGFAAP